MRYLRNYLFITCTILTIISCGTGNKPTYEIKTSSTPQNAGSIQIAPQGSVHDKGTSITLTPQPSKNYLFSEWKGDYSSSNSPLAFTLNNDVSITAVFEKKSYPLNISTEGNGTVTEELIKAQKDYKYGANVKLTGNPADKWEFIEWKDDINSTENPVQVSVEKETNVTAVFESKVKTYGGSLFDGASSTYKTSDGGLVIIGSSESTDGDLKSINHQGAEDIMVLKLDSNRNIEWTKTFGGANDDRGVSIIQSNEGGYVGLGTSYSNKGDWGQSYGDSDIICFKLDKDGNLIWIEALGGSGGEVSESIIETSDNKIVITGWTSSSDGDFEGMSYGGADMFVFKLSQSGNKEWVKLIGGSDFDMGISLAKYSNGVVIIGRSGSKDGDFSYRTSQYRENVIVKLNNEGIIELNKRLGESNSGGVQYLEDIERTSDGGYVTTGRFSIYNYNAEYICISKYDSQGNLQWEKLSGGKKDRGYSVLEVSNGNFLVIGTAESNSGDYINNNGRKDAVLWNLDSSGTSEWIRLFGGSSNDYGIYVTETLNGEFIITGYSGSNDGTFANFNSGGADIYTIKLSSDGLLK